MERFFFLQGLQSARQTELTFAIGAPECVDELGAEDAAEDLHGQEEAVARMHPASLIRREPARRNHTMQMRMQHQVLPPGVQDAEEADAGSKMFRVSGDFEQRSSACLKQQVIQQGCVGTDQVVEFVRQCKHDVKVA